MPLLNPSINTPVKHTIIVSVGDMDISKDFNSILSTYAIGTCIGFVLFDLEAKIGGLLHLMLADSSLSPEKAKKRPAMFADTGISFLLNEFEKRGGDLSRSNILLAGGASVLVGSDYFNVGKKNIETVKKIIKKRGLEVAVEDLGGVNNRTLHFNIGTGYVTIKTPVGTKTVSLR